MIKWKILLITIQLLFLSNTIFAQQQIQNIDSLIVPTNTSTITNVQPAINDAIAIHKAKQNEPIPYPSTTRDFTRLGYNTGLYFASAAVAFTVLYLLPESYSNWDKEAMKENGISWKWKQNIKKGPVMDHDDFFFNYVTHPWAGGIYYMTARSSGFRWYESFGYSVMMSSLFWEYGVEAFAEVPSTQDLIITPVIGSMMGEGFFQAKKVIMKKHRRILKSKLLGITTLFLIDPYNTVLDGLGYKQKAKSTLTFAPIGTNYYTQKPVLGLNFVASF